MAAVYSYRIAPVSAHAFKYYAVTAGQPIANAPEPEAIVLSNLSEEGLDQTLFMFRKKLQDDSKLGSARYAWDALPTLSAITLAEAKLELSQRRKRGLEQGLQVEELRKSLSNFLSAWFTESLEQRGIDNLLRKFSGNQWVGTARATIKGKPLSDASVSFSAAGVEIVNRQHEQALAQLQERITDLAEQAKQCTDIATCTALGDLLDVASQMQTLRNQM